MILISITNLCFLSTLKFNHITNFLLHYLVEIARELNYKSFSGSVLVGNRGMLHIVNNAGYPIISKRLDYGVVEFKFDITK